MSRSAAGRAGGTGSWAPLVRRKPIKPASRNTNANGAGTGFPNGSGSTVPAQRAMSNVMPMERAIEMNTLDRNVRALARLRKIIAQRADAQHAAAGGDRLSIRIEFRSGLEHFHALADIGIQPRN